MLVNINCLAVLVAALVAMTIGLVWFLPQVFGNCWAYSAKEYAGLSDEDVQVEPRRRLFSFFALNLVNAFILANLIGAAEVNSLLEAVTVGMLSWLGFGATFSSWPVVFAKQPIELWFMSNGAYLLMQAAMSVILTLWK